MTTETKNRIPWYLWPFAAIWKLLAVIVEMTGRLVAMILGIVLMIVGVLVSLTIVGAIVGVPLAVVGRTDRDREGRSPRSAGGCRSEGSRCRCPSR